MADDEYGRRFYFNGPGKTDTGGSVKPFEYGTEYAYTITHGAGSGVYNLVYTGGTGSVASSDFISSAELNVGCNTMNESYGYYHGAISDFKVYSRVLTGDELTAYIG